MAKEDPSGYGSGEQRREQLPLFDAEFRECELERQKRELEELERREELAG